MFTFWVPRTTKCFLYKILVSQHYYIFWFVLIWIYLINICVCLNIFAFHLNWNIFLSHAGLIHLSFFLISDLSCLTYIWCIILYMFYIFNAALMLFMSPIFLYSNIFSLPLCSVSVSCVYFHSLFIYLWDFETQH